MHQVSTTRVAPGCNRFTPRSSARPRNNPVQTSGIAHALAMMHRRSTWFGWLVRKVVARLRPVHCEMRHCRPTAGVVVQLAQSSAHAGLKDRCVQVPHPRHPHHKVGQPLPQHQARIAAIYLQVTMRYNMVTITGFGVATAASTLASCTINSGALGWHIGFKEPGMRRCREWAATANESIPEGWARGSACLQAC